jgi:ZIP family zinc transporter
VGWSQTLLLGFIAGVTILGGLPVGRLRHPAVRLRAVFNGAAVGILLFLLWDVLSSAWEPIDGALNQIRNEHVGYQAVLGYGALFVAGLTVGLLSLVRYEQWMRQPRQRADRAEPKFGPGAMATTELATRRRSLGDRLARWSPARQLALQIAVGIGLHNFAEGLAIGQSAANGEIALATMLVIGFGLHNATEGFGIVAPLAGDTSSDGEPVRPSWRFLFALGAIAGGPTFVGTIAGHAFTSEPVAVVFLTLAAGSIIYVITQLIGIATKSRRSDLLTYGLLIGLVAGFATDAIIAAGGA